MIKLAALAAACALACSSPVSHAADTGTPAKPPPAEQSDALQNPPEATLVEERLGQPVTGGGELLDAFHNDLFSDFHKARQKLKDMGIKFSLHERSEV